MQVCWLLLLGRFIGPGKLGQRSHVPGLRQGAFIDLRQRMMTCLPRAGTVSQYGQKLNPWQALGEGAGHIRKSNYISFQKCGTGLLVPFLCSESTVLAGVGDVV